MKQIVLLLSILFLKSFGFYGQSIFFNPITDINPNLSNPYTNGQTVDPNCMVSGISRGNGIFGKNANNRYDATSWSSTNLDSSKYYEFSINPIAGKKIDFLSFSFVGQVSANGPTQFAFRSSIDGFATDIGTIVAAGSTVSLSNTVFQNRTTTTTFRIYAWEAMAGTGTFSINSFNFDGSTGCFIPESPYLSDISISCSSTSFDVNWIKSLQADSYILDVATDSSFINPVAGYFNMFLADIAKQDVSGIIAGQTYYVRLRAKSDCGISDYSNTSVVFSPATIFDGISWDNGVPDITKKAIFNGNAVITEQLNACSCQINSGVNISVGISGATNSEAILNVENGLNVSETGSLVFENNASLIQGNDAAVNIGKITYKRISAPMKNFDFTYWSSPVTSPMQTTVALSPNTLSDKYFKFDGGANKWVLYTGRMDAAVGYIIRTPKAGRWANGELVVFPYSQPVAFTGIPNNGYYNFFVGADQYNLIGNPYPSAIDADLFMTNTNNSAIICGSLYFWTHNTAISKSGSSYIYQSNDYAVYNLTGGTKGAPTGGPAPSGQIAAGQSFFVGSKAAGAIEFNNSMRIPDATSNAQFYKMSKTKKESGIEKNRVWLNLTNAGGAFKQLLVGYITGATNGVDNLYDGASFDGNTYIDFYSIIKEANFTIQGRALPFMKTDEVALGYKTAIEGTFTISIIQTDGILSNQAVFLEDKSLNVFHNLKEGPYTFTTLKGTFNDRFVLVYVDKTVAVGPPVEVLDPSLGNLDYSKSRNQVAVSVDNHQITINSFEETIAKVMVYDLRGRLLYEKIEVNRNEFVVSNIVSGKQILVVVTELSNGLKKANEIIF
ncbi:T9SS sorting signal type C domain-containing protein [Flavobacterium sp. N3904]|uniref:T9SS sorting signal type C domain-containing protein n=1 Tax=Flavobacterium sp. N3904 TaxID=2986835 RepID=UPI00222453A7|nr:T9SS sorting signal type C domain-containing protein [Flavobacterium sp. N3904]